MLEDPPYMWRTLTASLTPDDWLAAVAQTYMLLLLSGEDDVDALCDHARAIVIEYGYRFGGEGPERLDVLSAWWRVSRPLDVLDGLKEVSRYPSRRIELTPFGEATLLERLRLDVTGPMSYP
jgi:hypothetical protein